MRTLSAASDRAALAHRDPAVPLILAVMTTLMTTVPTVVPVAPNLRWWMTLHMNPGHVHHTRRGWRGINHTRRRGRGINHTGRRA
jgi:hypothetical protein